MAVRIGCRIGSPGMILSDGFSFSRNSYSKLRVSQNFHLSYCGLPLAFSWLVGNVVFGGEERHLEKGVRMLKHWLAGEGTLSFSLTHNREDGLVSGSTSASVVTPLLPGYVRG